MANDELCALSIRRIAELYRRRDLSPVDVVDAYLDRIGRLNPGLNAYVLVVGDVARAAARAAEQRLRGDTDTLPTVFGIPFSVKETLPTAGIRTTFGSPLFRDFVPDEDAAAVDLMRRAGAIMLGKTNSPAFGWVGVTHNKLFGATPNPWRLTLTAGGSSGGGAVSACARLAPINIGTDGGGSLRIPASFTGIVGYKPSYGRVPNYPTGANWGLQHIGPLARSVEDAVLALDAMTGPDERDPYSLPAFAHSHEHAIQTLPARMRVLFCPDLGFAEAVDPEIVTICRAAAQKIGGLGHDVTEDIPGWSSPMDAWQTLFVAEVANRLGPFADTRPHDIEDKLLEFIAAGRRMAPDDYYKAWLAKNDWWQQVRKTFDRCDLIVSPTVACPPFAVNLETPGTITGKPVSFYGWAPFSAPFNMTGQPAISIPVGMTADGLPVGLQIVGRRFEDAAVLRVAAQYETAHPWVMLEEVEQGRPYL